jgi:hypothetical protein
MDEILDAFSTILQVQLSLPIPYPRITYPSTYLSSSLFTPYMLPTYYCNLYLHITYLPT